MPKDYTIKTSHWTIFRSAAEEVKERRAMNERLDNGHAMFARMDQAAASVGKEDSPDASAEDAWTNEGGHMNAERGYIVQTSPGNFKVILNHADADDTEHLCATVREGEALIRRNTPRPVPRDSYRDHDENASGSLPPNPGETP